MINDLPRHRLRVTKDLTRSIKRGHAWLFSDAVENKRFSSGTIVTLIDRKDQPIATGMFDPDHAISVRILQTKPPFEFSREEVKRRFERAIQLRESYFTTETTGTRLIAGEGDLLPGIVLDRYDQVAVLKLDGGAPEAFYNVAEIAEWLVESGVCQSVVRRYRERGRGGEVICGNHVSAPIPFQENGLRFTADVLNGQKTGFFLDQRDNRDTIRRVSRGARVLNLFSFNGGFSVAAGIGGAATVDSVDIAGPAIEAAEKHWIDNNLLASNHHGFAQDCFEFLEQSIRDRRTWDVVICDPPSFAPSERAKEKAIAAYTSLAQFSARVTAPDGLLALASCSSHITPHEFTLSNLDGIGRARRSAQLLLDRGLPIDHPTPFAMPELRYLKFQLFQLD